MSSGRAKKARKAVFNEGKSLDSLGSDRQRAYVLKEATRLHRQLSGQGLFHKKGEPPAFEARQFPCQKIKGKMVMIPGDAKPFVKDDGLWYLKIGEEDVLIVSDEYLTRENAKKQAEVQAKSAVNEVAKKSAEEAVIKMEPQVLGE